MVYVCVRVACAQKGPRSGRALDIFPACSVPYSSHDSTEFCSSSSACSKHGGGKTDSRWTRDRARLEPPEAHRARLEVERVPDARAANDRSADGGQHDDGAPWAGLLHRNLSGTYAMCLSAQKPDCGQRFDSCTQVSPPAGRLWCSKPLPARRPNQPAVNMAVMIFSMCVRKQPC